MSDSVVEKCGESGQVRWLKILPPLICVSFVAACLIFSRFVSFEELLDFTPENGLLAALVLWLLYAVKSMSIMIPATLFFIAAGHIYPFPLAVAVNIIGLAISFAIPYAAGRLSGSPLVRQISQKHPKAAEIFERGHRNNFFTVYATRAVTVLPNDLMSMLHGALKMPFWSFMAGSLIGILPEMLVETYIGGALSDFDLASALAMIGLIALTAVFSFFVNRKIKLLNEKDGS